MAVLGLRFCARASSSHGNRGPLSIAVRGPLTIAASPVAEHRLQTRRLSSCGPRVQPLRGMWDPPGPGVEPTSPALAGYSQPLRHQGSPSDMFLICISFMIILSIFLYTSWPFVYHLWSNVYSSTLPILESRYFLVIEL